MKCPQCGLADLVTWWYVNTAGKIMFIDHECGACGYYESSPS